MFVDFVYSLFCKFVFFFIFILFHQKKKKIIQLEALIQIFFLNYCYKAASSFTMSCMIFTIGDFLTLAGSV